MRQKKGLKGDEEEELGGRRKGGPTRTPTPDANRSTVSIRSGVSDARKRRKNGRWCWVPLHRFIIFKLCLFMLKLTHLYGYLTDSISWSHWYNWQEIIGSSYIKLVFNKIKGKINNSFHFENNSNQ